jgi:hypothetical protein
MVQSLSIQISQYSKKFWATWVIIPVIPALRKLRQEDYKFEASLGYIVKPCLKKKKKLKRVEVERGTKRALA